MSLKGLENLRQEPGKQLLLILFILACTLALPLYLLGHLYGVGAVLIFAGAKGVDFFFNQVLS